MDPLTQILLGGGLGLLGGLLGPKPQHMNHFRGELGNPETANEGLYQILRGAMPTALERLSAPVQLRSAGAGQFGVPGKADFGLTLGNNGMSFPGNPDTTQPPTGPSMRSPGQPSQGGGADQINQLIGALGLPPKKQHLWTPKAGSTYDPYGGK